jgi:uncharacterized protein (TIGR02996 family)
MSLEDVFLRDVLDHPNDDTPRLVYADWLQEQGDEERQVRAELIRTQCELGRLPPGDRRRAGLEGQARAILKEHGRKWTQPLRRERLGRGWEFRRGFVEGVTLSIRKQFVPKAARLFALAPIRAVRFRDASNELDDLMTSSYLARLRSIDLREMCRCGFCRINLELRRLFACPALANLTALVLASDRVNVETAQHLAASPYLTHLATLDLSNNALGDKGVAALAESPHLPALTSLALSNNGIGPEGARVLAGSELLARLTTLDLSDNRVGNAGARVLATSPNAAGLTMLDLRNNEISAAGARAVARSRHLGAEVQVRLGGNDVDKESGAELRDRFGKRVKW